MQQIQYSGIFPCNASRSHWKHTQSVLLRIFDIHRHPASLRQRLLPTLSPFCIYGFSYENKTERSLKGKLSEKAFPLTLKKLFNIYFILFLYKLPVPACSFQDYLYHSVFPAFPLHEPWFRRRATLYSFPEHQRRSRPQYRVEQASHPL